jgi:hypothetical protein
MRNIGLRSFLAQSRDATLRLVTQFDVALCNMAMHFTRLKLFATPAYAMFGFGLSDPPASE